MPKILDTPYKSESTDVRRKYATKEEAYAAHKLRVAEYNRQHKEQHRANVKKYHDRPEIAERTSAKAKAKYAALSPDQLEARRKQQRDHYAANRDRIRAEMRERYYAKKETA